MKVLNKEFGDLNALGANPRNPRYRFSNPRNVLLFDPGSWREPA